MKARRDFGNIGGNVMAWGYALIILGPMFWILSNSFKRQIDILMGTTTAPVTLINYQLIINSRQSHFLWNLWNSAVVSVASTVIVLIIATLAAFTVARLQPPRWVSFILLGWALLFHMLPTLTFVGSWYVMFTQAGLHGTYTALISAQVVQGLPMALFLMIGFVMNIPRNWCRQRGWTAAPMRRCSAISSCHCHSAAWRRRELSPSSRPGATSPSLLISPTRTR